MSGPAAPLPRDEAARLLGVALDAPTAEVQRAFLRAARSVHPDRLPNAGESERRAAGIAFARLLQARDALLAEAAEAAPAAASAFDPRPRERGLGGSLVVLALLAFLLVAIVTAQQALPGDPGGPAAPPAGTVGP